MNGEKRLKRLRSAVISMSALSYFMLHTLLTFILEPGIPGKLFLIFAFGFIYQGLEYFITIPKNENDKRSVTPGDMFLCGLLFPMTVFFVMGMCDPAQLGSVMLSTAGCIFLILLYRVIRVIIFLTTPKE